MPADADLTITFRLVDLVTPEIMGVIETLARQENASREHDRFVTGEITAEAYEQWCRVNLLSPPESLTGLCTRCRQPITGPDDYPDAHHDCAMQGMDEGFLVDALERGIEQLADGMRDYLRSRRLPLESPQTRALVNAVADALFALRSTLHGRAPRPTSCCDASASSPEPGANGSGREQ